jgi:hypothetical protein
MTVVKKSLDKKVHFKVNGLKRIYLYLQGLVFASFLMKIILHERSLRHYMTLRNKASITTEWHIKPCKRGKAAPLQNLLQQKMYSELEP